MNEAQRSWVERHAATTHERMRTARAELERRRDESIRPGDLVIFRDLEDADVQWAVLDVDSRGRALVVPADTSPLVGSADVAVEAEAPCGELALRCALGQWLPADLAATALRTGAFDADSLERARRRSSGRDGAVDLGGETDGDPEYHAHVRELETACRALLALRPSARQGRSRIPRWPSRPRRGRAVSLGLAAAALAAVSLAGNLWQWRTISQLHPEADVAAPIVDPPMIWPRPEADRGRIEPFVPAAGVSWMAVILHVPDLTPYETYRLELVEEPDGTKIWADDFARRDETRELFVLLPRRWLAPGDYRLVLHGRRGGQETLVERYVLRVGGQR